MGKVALLPKQAQFFAFNFLAVCLFWPCCAAGVWDLILPQPRTEPTAPALEAWSLNHWTAREAPEHSSQRPGSAQHLQPAHGCQRQRGEEETGWAPRRAPQPLPAGRSAWGSRGLTQKCCWCLGTRKGRKARGGGEQEARPPPPQQPAGGDLCSWKVPAGTKMTPTYWRLATCLHAFHLVSSPPLRPA